MVERVARRRVDHLLRLDRGGQHRVVRGERLQVVGLVLEELLRSSRDRGGKASGVRSGPPGGLWAVGRCSASGAPRGLLGRASSGTRTFLTRWQSMYSDTVEMMLFA